MTTSFSGTRISKNAINFNDNVIDIESLMQQINGEYEDGFDLGGSGENYLTAGGIFMAGKDGEIVAHPVGATAPLTTLDGAAEVTFNVVEAINALKKRMEVRNGVFVIPYENHNSKRGCATAVKKAVNQGFYGTSYYGVWSGGCHGYKCYEILHKLNFKAYAEFTNKDFTSIQDCRDKTNAWSRENAQPGDVAVMTWTIPNEAKGIYGHVCLFCENVWVSDFIQNNLWIYPDKMPLSIIFFRYSGPRVMPSNFKNIFIEKEDTESIIITDENGKPYRKTETVYKEGWTRTYIISSTKKNLAGNVKNISNSVNVSVYLKTPDDVIKMINAKSVKPDNTIEVSISSSTEVIRDECGDIYIKVDSK